MANDDRPLPTPQRSRFGRPLPGAEGAQEPLIADRMAQAAAEGRIEEFLEREIPEGEHARRLALMLMGMSGIVPSAVTGAIGASDVAPGPSGTAAAPHAPSPPDASGVTGGGMLPEIQAATLQGDVAGLMSLLRAEHERRSGGTSREGEETAAVSPFAPGEAATADGGAGPASAGRPGIDQTLVDELIRVAAENHVSVDWLLLRAVKLYLEEHRRTGRL